MPRQLFLVLEEFQSRFASFAAALLPLSVAAERPTASAVRIYFRERTGVALLLLEIASLADSQARWVLDLANRAQVPVLDPGRLADTDRDRFYDRYLGACETCLGDFHSADAAVRALAHKLGLADADSAGRQPLLSSLDAPARAHGKPKSERSVTAPLRPGISARTAVDERRSPRAATMAFGSPLKTVRGTPVSGTPAIDDRHIDVRFLRGDEWIPGRLRSLNVRGIFVATGAGPRLRDHVHIALRFRDAHVVVRGLVTRAGGEPDESVGFRASFEHLEPEPRRQLVALLRAAHAAGVALTPPPERSAVRFPVRWPVRVTTPLGHVTVPALDVSSSGLFIGTDRTELHGELMFLFPLDNGETPIRGHAEVARAVDSEMASARGLAPGIGIRIVNLSSDDERRYRDFLSRVRRRTARRVVVAAGPARAHAIATGLAAAGYAVSSGSDPFVLQSLWEHEARQPDLAIIDRSLGTSAQAAELEAMWRRRNVLCLTTESETPESARTAADRLLRIGRPGPAPAPAL